MKYKIAFLLLFAVSTSFSQNIIEREFSILEADTLLLSSKDLVEEHVLRKGYLPIEHIVNSKDGNSHILFKKGDFKVRLSMHADTIVSLSWYERKDLIPILLKEAKLLGYVNAKKDEFSSISLTSVSQNRDYYLKSSYDGKKIIIPMLPEVNFEIKNVIIFMIKQNLINK